MHTPRGGEQTYRLDPAGNLRAHPDSGNIVIGPGNLLDATSEETFRYDRRNHLATRISRRDQSRIDYRYDSFDLLVAIVREDPAFPSLELLTAGLGLPPRFATYDHPDATPHCRNWRAAYDALARRLWTEWTSQDGCRLRREFYWDGDRLAAELLPTGRLRIYQYASPSALAPLQFTDYASSDSPAASGKTYHVFANPTGLPLCIEDDQGRVVWWAEHADPYGWLQLKPRQDIEYAQPGASIEYNLRWPGHYLDPETGLHYNRYRYYDPRLGRYLQSDPLGHGGSPINLYAYCPNPLVQVGVLGLSCGEGDTPGSSESATPAGKEDVSGDAPPAPVKRTGTVTVTEEAKAQGAKSAREAKKLAELEATANALAGRGHDVVVHGEAVTGQAGELEIFPNGGSQSVLAESKRLDKPTPRAVQGAAEKGTAQVGDGGTVVIDGTGSGTTPETFEQGMGSFERTSAADRKAKGKPGKTGTVIFLHGQDGEETRQF